MKLEEIDELLELYGLTRILEDNDMTLKEAIDLLVELGYLDLEMYQNED